VGLVSVPYLEARGAGALSRHGMPFCFSHISPGSPFLRSVQICPEGAPAELDRGWGQVRRFFALTCGFAASALPLLYGGRGGTVLLVQPLPRRWKTRVSGDRLSVGFTWGCTLGSGAVGTG